MGFTDLSQVQDNISKLYNSATPFMELGVENEFRDSMAKPENRRKMYDSSADFVELGSFDEFESNMLKALPADNIFFRAGRAARNIGEKILRADSAITSKIVDAAKGLPELFDKVPSGEDIVLKVQDKLNKFTTSRSRMFDALRDITPEQIDNITKLTNELAEIPEGFSETMSVIGKAGLGDEQARADLTALISKPLIDLTSSMPNDPSEEDIDRFDGAVPFLNEAPMSIRKANYGFTKGVLQLVSGLSSPANILLLGGMVVGGGSRVLSAAFSTEMLAQEPELVKLFAQAYREGNIEDASEALALMIGTGAFAAAAGKHALKKKPTIVLDPEAAGIMRVFLTPEAAAKQRAGMQALVSAETKARLQKRLLEEFGEDPSKSTLDVRDVSQAELLDTRIFAKSGTKEIIVNKSVKQDVAEGIELAEAFDQRMQVEKFKGSFKARDVEPDISVLEAQVNKATGSEPTKKPSNKEVAKVLDKSLRKEGESIKTASEEKPTRQDIDDLKANPNDNSDFPVTAHDIELKTNQLALPKKETINEELQRKIREVIQRKRKEPDAPVTDDVPRGVPFGDKGKTVEQLLVQEKLTKAEIAELIFKRKEGNC